MAIPVSGNVALMYLTTLKEVAGPQYAAILQRAGWGRFLDAPPPAADTPVISGDESRRMVGVCYTDRRAALPRGRDRVRGDGRTQLQIRHLQAGLTRRDLRKSQSENRGKSRSRLRATPQRGRGAGPGRDAWRL